MATVPATQDPDRAIRRDAQAQTGQDKGTGPAVLVGVGIIAVGAAVLVAKSQSNPAAQPPVLTPIVPGPLPPPSVIGAPPPVFPPSPPTPPPTQSIYKGEQCVGNLAATINVNQAICPGTALQSPGGEVVFAMQTDGNLVVYHSGVAKWTSGTSGYPGAFANMQPDGNLVVYDVNGHARWASGTSGYSGATCRVQDDGNVVLYDASGHARWASNTAY